MHPSTISTQTSLAPDGTTRNPSGGAEAPQASFFLVLLTLPLRVHFHSQPSILDLSFPEFAAPLPSDTTMCVTNTTHRRPQPISLAPSQYGACPSMLSQRLLGSYAAATVSAPASPSPAAPQYYATTIVTEKPRPKRRRKPQKPGKTAKMNERHFVKHNYHDHAMDTVDDMDDHAAEEQQPEDASLRRRGGVSVAFPLKLHAVLDQVEADGLAHVISWQPHGRCFVVHEPKKFVDHVMPK